jgi:PAS domain S-box-containing protein
MVAERTSNAVVITDAEGRIVWGNESFSRLTGYSLDEILGKVPGQFLQVDKSDQTVIARMRHAVRQGEPFRGEVFSRRKDGREFWLDLELVPIHDPDHRLTGFIAIESDITERKRAEEARKEQYELAELLTDVSLALTQTADQRAMLMRCVQAVVRHLNVSCARIWTVHHDSQVLELQASAGEDEDSDLDETIAPVGASRIGRIASDRHSSFPNANGDLRELERQPIWRKGLVPFAGHPLIVNDRVVGVMALYACRDFSYATIAALLSCADSIALGIARIRADMALRAAHQVNNRLLGAISSILISLDGTDCIIRWNSAAEKTFGALAVDVVGKPFGEAGIAWDEPTLFRGLRLCRDQQETIHLQELVFTQSNGDKGYVSFSITPFTEYEQESVGLLLLGLDVTEGRLLQAQLVQAQKLEAIGQLAAGVAHEINTPMQFVSDNVEFLSHCLTTVTSVIDAYEHELSKEDTSGEAQRKAMQEVYQNSGFERLRTMVGQAITDCRDGCDRVVTIVRAMRQLSHPGSRSFEQADLNELIRTACTVSRNRWKYFAELELDLDRSLPLIDCKIAEITQVFLNLVVNAADAIAERLSPDSGLKGQIRIQSALCGERVTVEVSDTGCGIPEKNLRRIFDPFFTTKPIGQGTGQGLAIAYDLIVNKHQGTISVESVVNQGTRFLISFPVQQPRSDSLLAEGWLVEEVGADHNDLIG